MLFASSLPFWRRTNLKQKLYLLLIWRLVFHSPLFLFHWLFNFFFFTTLLSTFEFTKRWWCTYVISFFDDVASFYWVTSKTVIIYMKLLALCENADHYLLQNMFIDLRRFCLVSKWQKKRVLGRGTEGKKVVVSIVGWVINFSTTSVARSVCWKLVNWIFWFESLWFPPGVQIIIDEDLF